MEFRKSIEPKVLVLLPIAFPSKHFCVNLSSLEYLTDMRFTQKSAVFLSKPPICIFFLADASKG